ncbi:hypothetical protein D1872_230320 [compost metagenome]
MNRKFDDAVMAAVGAVQIAAVRGEVHIGGIILTAIPFGNRGDMLQNLQVPLDRIIRIHRERIVQFINAVRVYSVRMERKVARSGTRRQLDLPFGGQLSVFHAVVHHLIEAEIGNINIIACGAGDRAMRMRRFLPVLTESLAHMLHERGQLSRGPMFIQRETVHMPAGIVGRQQPAVRRQRQVARVRSLRRDGTQTFQSAVRPDGIADHGSLRLLAYRVQPRPFRIQYEKGRILNPRG